MAPKGRVWLLAFVHFVSLEELLRMLDIYALLYVAFVAAFNPRKGALLVHCFHSCEAGLVVCGLRHHFRFSCCVVDVDIMYYEIHYVNNYFAAIAFRLA